MTPGTRHLFVLAAVLAACVAFGLGGLAIGGFAADYTFVLLPAGGVALATTLAFGRSVWPAVATASVLTMVVASGNLLWSFTTSIGLTLAPAVSAALVDRVARGTYAFARPDTIVRFVAIVAATGAPITATTAVVATLLFGSALQADAGQLWLCWWLASLAGTLLVTPLVLLWSTTTPLAGARVWEVAESIVILAALTLVALAVFTGWFPIGVRNYPIEFLCVPFLLWAAFRLGRRTVALAAAILCGLAAWGTVREFGPFVRDSSIETTLFVQTYIVVTATMAAVIAAVVADHRHAQARLKELASTDPLTGLANYRRLLDVLRFEITRCNRTGRPFSVLFLDMDGLKAINDRYGHLAGSRALCRMAEVLKASCRAIDTPARFGGDEFAIVMPETSEDEGYVLLRRIADRLAVLPDDPPIAASGGVAVFPRDGSSPTQLLRSADKVLYDAKTRTTTLRRREGQRRTGT